MMDTLNRKLKSILLGSSVAFAVVAIASCASSQRQPHTLDAIEAALNEGHTQTTDIPTAESVANELLPQVNIQVPDATGVDVTQRFDVKVKNVPAREFLMGLVQGTSHNMVVHPRVNGNITFDLKNVTVPEVMEIVRDVYGYEYEESNNGYQVYPNTMRTQIFKINYIDVSRAGESQMSVSSGQVTDVAGSNNGSSNSSSGSSSSNTSGNTRQTIPGSQITTKSDSNFWSELRKSLNAMVAGKPGRNIVVNGNSGVVVVHAMPNELRAIRKFIDTTQTIMQRQVIIEAKILEVELSDGYQAGINWGAFGRSTGHNSSVTIGQTGGGSIFDSSTSIIDGNTGNVNPSAYSAVNGTATSAFGGVFGIALQLGNSFSSFIELLQTQGDVQVLSSPQVSTINNQKAVIKVGTDEFFITDVESNTNTSSSTSSTQNNVELTPFFSGVALDVIPQISENDEIILHIHPTVSSVVEKTKNISVSSTSTLSVPLAVSAIRESDTIVKARNGQVVIIGGLMKNSTSDQDASVPGLSEIPILGHLFKHKKRAYTKSELVILLRPIIIKDDQQWAKKLNGVKKRLGEYYPADGS